MTQTTAPTHYYVVKAVCAAWQDVSWTELSALLICWVAVHPPVLAAAFGLRTYSCQLPLMQRWWTACDLRMPFRMAERAAAPGAGRSPASGTLC